MNRFNTLFLNRPLLCDFENRLNFHCDVRWQRSHADRAARADADFLAEHFGEELAAAVDDLWVLAEIRGAIHHAEHFDDPLDAVETAEFAAERCQDGQPGLAGSSLARAQIEVGAD